jgi:hypothetical protein
MWGNAQKPSAQLADLLSGKVDWNDAPDAIKSWARLPIHQAAVQILSEPIKGTRRNMLGRIPASIRPHVEAEAKRLWGVRRA